MRLIGEWRTLDKSSWPRGAWDDEPDKVHWIDDASGYDCLMVRSDLGGNWCGYVGVPEGHPDYARAFGTVDVYVHGGLTYGDWPQPDRADPPDPSEGIAHVPQPGRTARLFWFGFDCAHAWDVMPKLASMLNEVEEAMVVDGWLPEKGKMQELFNGLLARGEYRNRAYVEHQVHQLALQLLARGADA